MYLQNSTFKREDFPKNTKIEIRINKKQLYRVVDDSPLIFEMLIYSISKIEYALDLPFGNKENENLRHN